MALGGRGMGKSVFLRQLRAALRAAPEIGVLAEDPEVPSGAEFVERLRAAKPRYPW